MGDQLGGTSGTSAKMFGRPKCSLKSLFGRPSRSLRPGHPSENAFGARRAPSNFLQSTALLPCSYWKYDTLYAIVECGSAFFEDISKGNANFSELPHTLNTGGNINISFVLSSKGTLVCHSSSSVLVLNKTFPTLLLIHYSTFHCHFPTYR